MPPPEAGRERRPLPYEALDPAWEEREFRRFRAACGPRHQQAPYGPYLFGRLLQEDLHQSCRPALPEGVDALHGVTIQGMCILQVVDVANIGATFEHRTEHTPPGPTRTLKLGLTDGHQLIFGFEFRPLPQFSVGMTRGTKIVVENVPVRHGLLMLAPSNCELLGGASPASEDRNGVQAADSSTAKSGAYSAALMTTQFNASQQPVTPLSGLGSSPSIAAGASASARTIQPRIPAPTPTPRASAACGSVNNSTSVPVAFDAASSDQAAPAVFVEIHSDDDCSSDNTDPMVEHLFYSPKTPRLKHDARTAVSLSVAPTSSTATSRKRPRPTSIDEPMVSATETSARAKGPQSVSTQALAPGEDTVPSESSFSLLTSSNGGVSTAPATTRSPLDPTRPFQYFSARSSSLSASSSSQTLHIRACIKSVVGFQFNTGRYLLRVLVEDCTATREADVAESFVQRLMGVPCSEFLEAMRTRTAVAHQWAARMQFTLMNLEGVMTFQDDPAKTSTSSAARLTLLDCRDFRAADTRELLQRVKESLMHQR